MPGTFAFVKTNGAGALQLYLGRSASESFLFDYASAPAWSADGNVVAFFGQAGINSPFNSNGIWLFNILSGQLRQLVGAEAVKNLNWSPDGSKLAFEVALPGDRAEIRVVEVGEGREEGRFPGSQPTWQGDGQKLIIKVCDARCSILLVNFQGADPQEVIPQDSATALGLELNKVSYPALSWNGQYLAFTYEEASVNPSGRNFEIYVLNRWTGTVRNLTNRSSTDVVPVFGPDGQTVFFRTDHYDGFPHSRITAVNVNLGTNENGSREVTIKTGIGAIAGELGLVRPAIP